MKEYEILSGQDLAMLPERRDSGSLLLSAYVLDRLFDVDFGLKRLRNSSPTP